MPEQNIISRTFILSIVGSIVFVLVFYLTSILNSSSKIVFCDVGQGDAAYLRINNKIDVLIDAGPDKKIIDCLSRYMPFYDHTIELAFLSHPQKDHYGGYLYILDRYNIKHFVESPVKSTSRTYAALENKLKRYKINVHPLYKGEAVDINTAHLILLWPSEKFVLSQFKPNMDPNTIAQVLLFQQGSTKILFTADKDLNSLKETIPKVNILKIPHHGSRFGFTREILALANPAVSVISVGKNNTYGHPATQVLDILKASNTIIRRTDLEGDIVYNIH